MQNDNDDIFFHRRKIKNFRNKLLVITKDTSVLAALVITMYMAGDKLCVNTNSVKITITCTCTTMLPELASNWNSSGIMTMIHFPQKTDQEKIKKIKRSRKLRGCVNKSLFLNMRFLVATVLLFCFCCWSWWGPRWGRSSWSHTTYWWLLHQLTFSTYKSVIEEVGSTRWNGCPMYLIVISKL